MKQKHKNYLFPEVGIFALCVGYLVFAMRGTLLSGTTTLTHDNLYWDLPIFHYFAEGIRHGVLPLWNPYSHGGEPLLPAYLQLRMLDPMSFVTAWFGQFFTDDLVTLFAWDRLVKAVVGTAGVYILLRQWASSRLVRYSLIPIVLWSSLTLTSFHQNGILDEFYCAPYVAFFALRILYQRDYRLRNWVGAGIFFGVGLQSYFFVGSVILITFILAGFAVARRSDLAALFQDRRNLSGAAVVATVLLLMSGPNLFMFLTKADFDFVARNLPAGWETMRPNGGPFSYDLGPQKNVPDSLIMPYKMIYYSGTSEHAVDFAGLLVPPFRFLDDYNTDAIQFMGALVLLSALIGMVSGRHPLKRVWAIVGAGFGLLILGPYGGLHWLLYNIYPPLWFVRHTHLLVNFFLMAVLYFYVLGADFILRRLEEPESPDSTKNGPLIRRAKNPGRARMSAMFIVYLSTICFAVVAGSWQPEVVGDISPLPFILILQVFILWIFRSRLEERHTVIAIILFLVTMALLNYNQKIDIFVYLLYSLAMPVLLVLITEKRAAAAAGQLPVPSGRTESTGRSLFPAESFTNIIAEAVSRALFIGFLIFFCVSVLRLLGHYGYFYPGALFALSLSFLLIPILGPGDKTEHERSFVNRSREIICRVSLLGIVVSLLLPFVMTENLIDRFVPDLHLPGLTIWLELIMSLVVLALRPTFLFSFIRRYQSDHDFGRVLFRLMFFLFLPWALVTLYLLAFSQPRFTMGLVIAFSFFLYIATATFWPRRMFAVYEVALRWPRAMVRILGGWRRTVPYLLLLFVIIDLLSYVEMSSKTWKIPRPDTYLSIPKASSNPHAPDTRVAIPRFKNEVQENTRGLDQPVRYSDLLTRQAAALDFPRTFPEYPFRATTFHEVLQSPRWNTFTAPLAYSRLIHSGLSPVALATIFAVDQPLLQYRSVALQSDDFIELMSSRSPRESVDILEHNVVISSGSFAPAGAAKHTVPVNLTGSKIAEAGYDYNSVSFDVHVPGEGYLYYADGYDPFWRAYVDGREVPVYRANGNFKAIPADTSSRHVEFFYDPRLLKLAVVLFEITFMTGIIFLLASYVRDYRHEFFA